MEKRYLFVAKKSNSEDYRDGCYYHSDFEIRNWITREELVKAWGEYLQKNMNLRRNERGYVFYVFRNGIQLFAEESPRYDGGERYGGETDEYWEHYTELEKEEDEYAAEACGILSDATALANKLQGEMVTKEQKKAAETATKEVEAAKEQRRLQFEKLQKEFLS